MRYSHNILIRICSFIFVAAVIYNVYYYTMSPDKTANQPGAKAREAKHDDVVWSADTPLDKDDFNLKGIRLGESLDSVLKKLGEPKMKKQMQQGASYIYSDIEAVISAENLVINILTNTKATSTRRNIHPGSKLEEVITAYGKDYKETAVNGLDLYEYMLQRGDISYVLRFAVQAENKEVSYIGSRTEAQEAQQKGVKTVNYYFDTKTNKLVLRENDIMLKLGDKLIFTQEGISTAVVLATNSSSDYTKLFKVFNGSSINGDITLTAKATGFNTVLLWVPHNAPAAAELKVYVSE